MPQKSKFKNSISSILFIMAALLFTYTGWAQTSKTSQSSGNWNDITWDPAGVPSALDDVSINTTVTIPLGTPLVEINNLNIGSSGKLIVNGYLKVNGNLTMDNNSPEFSMGGEAIVTVVGDFIAANKIDISISSFLIIQGDFTKSGAGGQGTLDVDEGNIYILGTASGFDDFTTCDPDPYSGSTADPSTTCDYGDLTDYENNSDTFPPEVLALTSCFAISELQDQTVCTTNDVTFSINPIANVNYQWQVKIGSGIWNDISNEITANYTITNTNLSLSGNTYRVVLKPVDTGAKCKIGVSLAATLTVVNENNWIGATSSDWNDASNWSCNFIPKPTSNVNIPSGLSNYPDILTGITGLCNNLTIQLGSSLVLTKGTIQINGLLSNSGSFDAQAGTVNFSGTAAQTIAADSFLNNQIENLSINSAAVVTNVGLLNISGILLANSGTFNTGDFITLISSGVQTALIDGSGTGTINGNVTMQRLIDPAFGYKLISAPFQGVTVGNFASVVDLNATFETFYAYDENREISGGVAATGYIPYVDPAGFLGVFKGYAVNFGGTNSAKMVEVTGTITSGPQSIDLSNNNGTYTQGFNLVGNPYPSPIDWNAPSGWTKTNVDNALYFFTTSGTDQYTGVYTSAVNGAGGGSVIPSMQGFFVHVTDGAYPVSAVLSSTDAVRVNNFSNEFVKSPEEQKKTITLSAKFDDSSLKDDLLFYFDQSASKGFDSRLDALKLMNTDPSVPNLYCLTNTKKAISINAIPNLFGGSETVIPLGISTLVNKWITISLNDLPYDLASNYIYLIDLDENKIIDLQDKTDYRFFSTAGENETRFKLRISNTPISKDDMIFDKLFSLDNSHGTIKVKMNLNRGEVGDIKVSSLTGQILDTHFVANKDVVEITGIKSTGLYIISFYTTNGVFSKKVIIKN